MGSCCSQFKIKAIKYADPDPAILEGETAVSGMGLPAI